VVIVQLYFHETIRNLFTVVSCN